MDAPSHEDGGKFMRLELSARRCPLLIRGVLLTLLAIASNTKSVATTPVVQVAVTTCATCNSQATLSAAALAYATTWIQKTPPGYVGQVQFQLTGATCASQNGATTILVVSTLVPISGAFWPCYRAPHGIGELVVVPINSSTDAQVISADNAMFHRSAKITPIPLPHNLPLVPWADATELYGAFLAGPEGVPMVGVPTFSLWHGIMSGTIGAVEKGTFMNIATGQTFTLWSGDTIKVVDPNGNSALFQWVPSLSPPWVYKEGSLKDKSGNPIPDGSSAPTPKTGGSPQPLNPISFSYPGGPLVTVTPWYNNPTPDGTVTVGDPIDPGSDPSALTLASGD